MSIGTKYCDFSPKAYSKQISNFTSKKIYNIDFIRAKIIVTFNQKSGYLSQ